MPPIKLYLIIWFVCGVIDVLARRSTFGHTDADSQWANGTAAQTVSQARERQHQSQYQYGLSKPVNKQQPNRGRSNGLNELRKNLTAQKLWERQGDDPEQNSVNLSPIHQIHQKIQQSDVSQCICGRYNVIYIICKHVTYFGVIIDKNLN